MDQGDSAMEKKDYEAALKAYQGAHAIMNVPTTGIEIVHALIAMGKLVEARDMALSVTRLQPNPGEPKAFAKARREADELADQLAPRIATLEIEIHGSADKSAVKVALDGVELSKAVVGLPRKVNPGPHVVTANAPGFGEAKAEVTLSEGDKQSVKLELQPAAAGGEGAGAGAAGTPQAFGPGPDKEGSSHTSALVYIGFGLGAAGIAVGSVAGGLSLSKTNKAKESCQDNLCRPEAQDDIDSAKTFATVSNIGFAVGGAGIVLGVVGLLTSGKKEAPVSGSAARVRPAVGLGFVGVDGIF